MTSSQNTVVSPEERTLRLLAMQDSVNTGMSPTWRDNDHNWRLAIFVESAELMDHLAWKWWKAGEGDIAQARMELIDIVHFHMSDMLQQDTTGLHVEADSVCLLATDPDAKPLEYVGLEDVVPLLHTLSLEARSMAIAQIRVMLGMTFDDMYKMYVGKNILNEFRQSHGYKEGTYNKIWGGEEDNEVLASLLDNIGDAESELIPYLYTQLEAKYLELSSNP